MREVAESRAGEAVVVVCDHPRQVTLLLLMCPPLYPIWRSGGCDRWQAGQLTPHLTPRRRGRGGRGGGRSTAEKYAQSRRVAGVY
jgi:hypothetical protein